MTDLKKLRELAVKAIPKIPGICNECSFELSYRHWYGCSIPEDAFAEAINPQAIIEILDRLERYEKALEKIPLTQFWAEAAVVAREALEGGK